MIKSKPNKMKFNYKLILMENWIKLKKLKNLFLSIKLKFIKLQVKKHMFDYFYF